MSSSSYDELLRQVENLKAENCHLRRELKDNSTHLTHLETEASSMKHVLVHLQTAMDEDMMDQTMNDLPEIQSSPPPNNLGPASSAGPAMSLSSLSDSLDNAANDSLDQNSNSSSGTGTCTPLPPPPVNTSHYPLTPGLFNWNFHPLEVVSR